MQIRIERNNHMDCQPDFTFSENKIFLNTDQSQTR